MIAFGCAITEPEEFDRCARPGLELAREPDSELLLHGAAGGSRGSIFRNYNLIIDRALELQNLEALVIVHQDAEIVEPRACDLFRAALAEPDVGLVGCAGAIGVRSIAWWEGSVTWSAFTHRYSEHGGGEIDSLTWLEEETPSYAALGEVDSLDGYVLCFSPLALSELRFDESLGRFHGYDYDICMQARAAGMKVVTADVRTIHHHDLELISDVEAWIAAHMRLADKWEGRFPDDGGGSADWRQRARRAEAEAAAARILRGREELLGEARLVHTEDRLAALEAHLAEIESSPSWRLTAPLRRLRQASRARRGSAGVEDAPDLGA